MQVFLRGSMLALQRFLIKEQVALFRRTATYAIFDPDSEEQVGIAREKPGGLIKLLRWFIPRRLLPTRIRIHELDEEQSLLCTIYRQGSWWRSRIDVCDADENLLGYFQRKLFSLGGGFWVCDEYGNRFAEVRGDLKGWNFHFRTEYGREIGLVAKAWAGIGKELFTSADNYIVEIDYDLARDPIAKLLLLAAALAIDLVYKERV
jgi:hypothetical protein